MPENFVSIAKLSGIVSKSAYDTITSQIGSINTR
jgi:hypothetical protein